jgi:hypothetical protein
MSLPMELETRTLRNTISLAVVAAVLTGAALTGCTSTSAAGSGDAIDASTKPTKAASAPALESTEDEAPAQGDADLKAAKLTSCKVGEYGPEVTGTVTNTDAVVSDVSVGVEILNAKGDRLDEASSFDQAVKPGQKIKFDAVGLEDADSLGTKEITCRVMSIDIYPSE